MKVANGKETVFNGWVEKNTDPYSSGVIRFAKRWAELMEKEIANGKSIPDIAEACSNQADTEGITGFMYGCAVQMLAQCWKYGEELRKWHNGQYGHSGNGVVNPAILTIGCKDKKDRKPYVRKHYYGENLQKNDSLDEQLDKIKADSKGCYATIIDIHD